ncbi:cytochrome b/b6 domain-containing protein [Solemya velum gill symbiont]|uniref:cytochrome b/b6 domain-containing protein n=1 Tax=Solemya velum gill symbiont TaxID=2340 RepID=UPI000995F0A9|nr:cytochrome b/b6 domain-containing protein [Solemya velum gill symbiont]OOY59464.1 cytochrome B [Solemya velum gill symbiont]OOY74262.1 cytochrome B [Solemya velum gill symbiont]OOY76911.1 cytochrome B [Solemya velum gill symbiont]OOY82143.1 cytochrome B [Solemya velum gill symbiont]OOY84679.1 cytochrome B [Solemya velum gill symbiont]
MKNSSSVRVWDPFVRIFHWGLVLSFLLAYVTEEDILPIHTLAGYVVTGLLSLRIIWGFIGTHYAKFSEFIYSPSTIYQFLVETGKFRAPRYLGHNPAGGAMIFMLIASLLLTSVSGLVVYGIAEQAGPLAGLMSGFPLFFSEITEEIHEFFANFTLLLVILHVGGIFLESLVHKENLVLSMITGRKRASNSTEAM